MPANKVLVIRSDLSICFWEPWCYLFPWCYPYWGSNFKMFSFTQFFFLLTIVPFRNWSYHGRYSSNNWFSVRYWNHGIKLNIYLPLSSAVVLGFIRIQPTLWKSFQCTCLFFFFHLTNTSSIHQWVSKEPTESERYLCSAGRKYYFVFLIYKNIMLTGLSTFKWRGNYCKYMHDYWVGSRLNFPVAKWNYPPFPLQPIVFHFLSEISHWTFKTALLWLDYVHESCVSSLACEK